MVLRAMTSFALLALLTAFSDRSFSAKGEETLEALTPTQDEIDKGYIAFQHSSLQVLLPGRKPHPNQCPPEGIGPEYVPNRQAITNTIALALARGEFKSIQIGIHALKAMDDVRLELETNLEARVYRGVDEATSKMLMEYPNPVWSHLHAACLDESSTIAHIEQGATAFFWITLHAPKSAAPGVQGGKVRIQTNDEATTEFALEAKVRPFELERARIAYAPFYYVDWGVETGPPKFTQSDAWIEAIYRDMAEHSHTSLIGLAYGVPGAEIDFSTTPPRNNRTFDFLLPLAAKVGLTSPDIPVFQFGHNAKTKPEKDGDPTLQQQNEALSWYDSERRKQGWPELVGYGHDEPAYPNPGLRQRFEPVREVRMRLGTAMFAPAAYGLGDLHDIWIVRGGEITREMCSEAKRQGAEVWTYLCDAMSHRPLYERHFAGLYVWAYGLTGHSTWHYYAQEKFKLVWFREGDLRPMPTMGWETRRAGIDDYRYLQMLEASVAAKPDDPVASEAKAWMTSLRNRILEADRHIAAEPGTMLAVEEYDRIQDQAAAYIELLGVAQVDRHSHHEVSSLKDEAALFRNRSIDDCMAGLASQQAKVRRAAACALREHGAKAAPAVGALASLLSDEEVRMPAIRALEAMGPHGAPALSELTVLTRHPDGFVSLGASIAMRAIEANTKN